MKAIIIFLILSGFVYSQSYSTRIKGKVTDRTGQPLAFVNVYILNSYDGAMSDENGYFEFQTGQKGKLEIVASLIGYKKFTIIKEIDDSEISELEIILRSEAVTTGEVIVTASSFASDDEKGVALTSMDVYTTPGGAADIFQTIKTLPGITLVSESAELYVRGGDPKETLTLIDQATLYHPYTFESAYGGLFSNISTSGIKDMYFSSGGFSAKYGNALSGVLELETLDNPGRRIITVGLSMANAEATATFPIIGETLGLRIGGRKSFTKPIFWINGRLNDFTVMPASQDANLLLNYNYSSTGRIKLFAYAASDKQGVFINRPGYIDEFKGFSNSRFYNLQWREIIFSDFIVKSGLSLQDFESNWKLGVLDLKRTDRSFKNRTDIEFISENNIKILAGVEFEKRNTKYIGTIPENDYDLRNEAGFTLIDSKLDISRLGGYGEIQYSGLFSIPGLFASVGIRSDMIPELNLNWVDVRTTTGYRVNEATVLNFGWGIYHQHSDPRLYSEKDGNPSLLPMRADHYIFSYNTKLNNTDDFRIEMYHKNYSNLPLEDDILNFSNHGYGFANGIDVMLKGSVWGLSGWASYGYINTKRKWMESEFLASSSFDITHNFTLVAKYNILPELQAGINYKYATGRPFTPVTGSQYIDAGKIYEPLYGMYNSERYKDYHRLDFRLTYLTNLFNSFFTVFYVECLNILNIKNIFGYSYNYDYSQRTGIGSYFGRRTVVVGTQINL